MVDVALVRKSLQPLCAISVDFVVPRHFPTLDLFVPWKTLPLLDQGWICLVCWTIKLTRLDRWNFCQLKGVWHWLNPQIEFIYILTTFLANARDALQVEASLGWDRIPPELHPRSSATFTFIIHAIASSKVTIITLPSQSSHTSIICSGSFG